MSCPSEITVEKRTKVSFPNSDGVIAMTHLDKTDDMIFASDGKIPARNLEHLKYVSYGETRDCVKIK